MNSRRGFHGSTYGGKSTGSPKYGRNLASKSGLGGEEFERLPDEESRNEVFAMADVGGEMERAVLKREGRVTIKGTKTWGTRSRDDQV